MVNQFLKIAEVNPWVGIERLLEDYASRERLFNSPEAFVAFKDLLTVLQSTVFNLTEDHFDNPKRSIVYVDYFGILFATLQNQDTRRHIEAHEQAETVNLGRIVEFLLSSIAIILQKRGLNEAVEEKLERVVRLA